MKAESTGSRPAEAASTAKKKVVEAASSAQKSARHIKQEAEDLGERLGTSGRQAIDSAHNFVGSVHEVRGQLTSALSKQAESRPYVALGAAAGLGFVLAGGLTVRLTSKLVGIGGRMLLSAAVRQLIDPSGA